MPEPKGALLKLATGLPPAADAPSDRKGQYVVARFAAQNDHWVPFYKTWTKNLNFLVGEHWRTKWDGTALTWNVERDVPPWRQQPVTNLTFAVYRSALAKMTKQKPTMEVVPASGSSEDKEASELSESLLVHLWRSLKKPQKLPIALGWMVMTGMAWIRVGWDPEAGEMKPRTVPVERPVEPLGGAAGLAAALQPPTGQPAEEPETEEVEVAADEQGEPYLDEDGNPDFAREPDLEPQGEICWEIISPLAVRFNPEAASIFDASELYVAMLWPVAKAAEHFGVDEDRIRGGDESGESLALFEDMMSAATAGFPRSWADQGSIWGVSQQQAIGDRALVIEYYADKSKAFPEGRHWITCNGVKVWPPEDAAQAKAAEASASGAEAGPADDAPAFEHGEAPLPFGFWPPLVPMFDTPVPGQPTALGLLSQVVPLNEQLNVLDGKIAEKHVMDSMGGIWFRSPEDAGMVITSEPAQVIESRAMGKRGAAFAPFQAQMHPLPEPVYRERDVLTNKVMVVSGLSAVDLSQHPQGVTSGRALLVTQETSDSVFMPTLFAMEAALEECGRRELVIAQQKYREERTISVRGDDGQWLFRSFTNADLGAGHDVRVQVGSSFPWSKAAQWDTKLSVIQALPQLVVKPDGSVDREALAKYLDAGTPGLSTFESDQDPDLVEIQREHAMFEQFDPSAPDGSAHQVPQIAFWQTHLIHLKEHQDFMKKSFARFQRWHPAAREAFLEHIRLTMEAVQQATAQLMGGVPGAAGGAGGAGAPGGPGGDPNAAAMGGGAPPTVTEPGAPPPIALVRPNAGGGSAARLGPGDFRDAQRAAAGG